MWQSVVLFRNTEDSGQDCGTDSVRGIGIAKLRVN
jgi:hypothetical protein